MATKHKQRRYYSDWDTDAIAKHLHGFIPGPNRMGSGYNRGVGNSFSDFDGFKEYANQRIRKRDEIKLLPEPRLSGEESARLFAPKALRPEIANEIFNSIAISGDID